MEQKRDLEKEVTVLKAQVKKLQTMLLATGQQLMQLQMEQRRSKIDDLGAKAQELRQLAPDAAPRQSEYVTESDLNDMVVELQGQFNILDEKSIKRALNSQTKSDLVPLPNVDGEYSPTFPATLQALQTLSREQLFKEWNFLELMPNVESLDDILNKDNEKENQKVLDELYDSFSSFIGVNPHVYPWKS